MQKISLLFWNSRREEISIFKELTRSSQEYTYIYVPVWDEESFLLNSGVTAYVWH